MKIKRFVGRGIHQNSDYDVRFNEDLTFLTGINGSGKTTVLNCIVSLIAPSLSTLANLNYDQVSIEVEHNGAVGYLSSQKDAGIITISASHTHIPLTFSALIVDDSTPSYKQDEMEAEYYKSILSANTAHPVIRYIQQLPTPMFLGLDRRARFDDPLGTSRYPARAPIRPTRTVFRASLIRSLNDASAIAERKQRDAGISFARNGEKLRKDLILQLLELDPRHDFEILSLPTDQDRRSLTRLKNSVSELHKLLGLERDEVEGKLTPFVEAMQSYARQLPSKGNSVEFLRGINPSDPRFEALMGWNANTFQFKKIEAISATVSKYLETNRSASAHTEKYLSLVNRFLRDSGKVINFDERGLISYTVDGVGSRHPMSTLSSGEAQIFVILTHLSFHPHAQGDVVFIIDEPEISLHVQWQELFVDSVIEANPNVQYLMATHSPSIILDRVDKCIDIQRTDVTSRYEYDQEDDFSDWETSIDD